MRERVSRFLLSADESFSALALDLFRWQRERVPDYRGFCGDSSPQVVTEIPAVPVSLFRDLHLCITTEPGARFRSSGTTSSSRSVHQMPDTRLYDLAASTWFSACLPTCPRNNCLSLVPSPLDFPDSSLGHMIDTLAPGAHWASSRDGLAHQDLKEWLAAATEPVFLAATSLALLEVLQHGLGSPLPPGSVVMATGGSKGQHLETTDEDLREAALSVFGSGIQWVREYGMCELSSQLWDTGEGYRAPPWLHVYTVDPTSGAPCEGPGLLTFVDLANWGSCLAVETQDVGEIVGEVVVLHGRLESAPTRGCSLLLEETP